MRKTILVLAAALLTASVAFGIPDLTWGNGTKTVTTAGTAVRLVATSTVIKQATIQALSSNTGVVCIGSSTVLVASKNGICLSAGQATPLFYISGFPHDLNQIWVDSAVNGEGVAFAYEQ